MKTSLGLLLLLCLLASPIPEFTVSHRQTYLLAGGGRLDDEIITHIEWPSVIEVTAASYQGEVMPLVKLEHAEGVWFGGGHQSRLSQRYAGTNLKQVLSRLLFVGGTSAGATYLGGIMLVDEHEEPGLGLFPNWIIDQHFTQRGRLGRLLAAIDRHPQMTGVGIDEGTALLIRDNVCRVIGAGTVTFLSPAGTRVCHQNEKILLSPKMGFGCIR